MDVLLSLGSVISKCAGAFKKLAEIVSYWRRPGHTQGAPGVSYVFKAGDGGDAVGGTGNTGGRGGDLNIRGDSGQ